MSIRRRFFLGLVPGLLSILLLGLVSYLTLHVVVTRFERVEYILRERAAVEDLELAIQRAIVPPTDYLVTGDPVEREHFTRLATDVEERFNRLRTLIETDDPGRKVIQDTYPKWQEIRALADRIFALPAPTTSPEGPQLMARMDLLADEIIDSFNVLHEKHQQQIALADAAAHVAQRRFGLAMVLSIMLAVGSGLLFAWYFSTTLVRPLGILASTAEALGKGFLEARAPLTGEDEVGRLAHVFNSMAEALQRRLDEERALSRIIQKINASRDVPEVFRNIVDDLRQLAPCERISIALFNDPRHPTYFTMYLVSGAKENPLPVGHTMPVTASAAAPDMLTGRPHITDDLSTELDFPAERLLYHAGYRSRINLPLVVEGEIIGALNLGSTRPRAFANINLAPLQQVAAALAAALNQSRLQEELATSLRRRTAETNALNAIAAAAVSSPDLKRVLNIALEHLLAVLGVEAGGVYLPPPDTPNTLELVAHRGLPASFRSAVTHLPTESGFTGQVFREGKPVVLEDIAAHAPDKTLPIVNEFGWRAFAAVPLRFGDRVLGVLMVSSRERRHLSPEDLSFLQAAADQLGTAVENAHLRRKSEQRLRELETLSRFAETLNRTVEPTEALQQALDVLREHLHIPAGWFVAATDDPKRPFTCTTAFNLPPALRAPGALDGTCRCQALARRGELREAINLLECERLSNHPPEETNGLRYHATVPVQSGQRLLGLLNLALPEGRILDADDLHLLTAAGRTLAVALERARLHAQVKARRVEEQEILLRLSRALLGETDMQNVMDVAVRIAAEALNVEYAAIALLEPDGAHYSGRAGIGWPPEMLEQTQRIPLSENTALAHAIHTGKPVIIPDEYEETRFPIPPWVAEEGIRASLLVPMIVEGRPIGGLVVNSRTPREWSEDEVRLLSLIAGQTAQALERARLYAQAQERLERITALHEIDVAITSQIHLQDTLDVLLQKVTERLKVDAAAIALVHPETGALTYAARRGPNSDFFVDRWLTAKTSPARLVVQSGRPLVIADMRTDPRVTRRRAVLRRKLASYLAVPLRVRGESIGVLEMVTREARAFTTEEVDFFITLAGQAAIVIDNARLFDMTLRRAEELAGLYRLSLELADVIDPREVCGKVTAAAAEALGVERCLLAELDHERREVRGLAPAYGIPDDLVKRIAYQVNDEIVNLWDISRSPYFIIADTGILPHPLRALAQQAKARSLLAARILAEGQPLGILFAANKKNNGTFDESDARLLAAYAQQAAIALARARAHQAAQRRLNELEAYQRVTQSTLQTLDLRERLNVVLQEAMGLLGAEVGAIYLVENGRARAVAWDGPGEVLGRMPQDLPTDDRPSWQQVLQHWQEHAETAGLHTTLALPLTAEGGDIGAILLASPRENAFPAEQVRTLEALAEQAAVAIEHARLYRAEQTYRQELAALYRLSDALNATDDLTTVQETIVRQSVEAVGVTFCRLLILEGENTFVCTAAHTTQTVNTLLGTGQKEPEAAARYYRKTLQEGRPRVLTRAMVKEADAVAGLRLDVAQSICIVPLFVSDEAVGVLVFGSTAEAASETCDPDQLRLIEAIADQAASAIYRARLHDELKRAYQEVQEALQLREDMIRNVSHELRTPLTAIRGYAELLLNGFLGALDSEQSHALEVIHKNAERLRFMVERLLTLQSLRAKEWRRERIAVHAWLNDVAARWQPRFQEARKELVVEVATGIPPICGDRNLLDQVIDNLIDNAVKFSPHGKNVYLRAWEEGDRIILAVQDEGVGIPPDSLDRIFDKFYQVDASPTRRFEGMGIGLALVKEIVEHHGGRVWVESEGEGKGSTFYVALPSQTTCLAQ